MKKKLPVLLGLSFVALVSLLTVACSGAIEITLGDLAGKPYGYVYDSDGKAIVGASVVVKKASGTALQTTAATTDSDGKFTLTSKETSSTATYYTVSITATGYTFADAKVYIAANDYLWNMGSFYAKPAVVKVDVTGKVSDAKSKTNAVLANVVVKLRTIAAAPVDVATATSDTNGAYSMTGVTPGTYELVATLTGKAFISQEVAIDSSTTTLPPVLGMTATNDVTVILTWNGSRVADLDAHMTVPPTGATGVGTFSAYEAVGSGGFSPPTTEAGVAGSGRTHIGYDKILQTSNRVWNFRGVVQDTDAVDTTTPSRETFTLPSTGLTGTSGTVITNIGDGPSGTSGLLAGTDKWVGVLEYYVDSYDTAKLATQGSAYDASAKIYVMQSTNMLGVYTMPGYTGLDTVSALRIHAFDTFYVIYPDLRVLTTTNPNTPVFRSITRGLIDGVIVTKRMK